MKKESGGTPPPSWWENSRYFYVDGYGYFDKGHLQRGWTSAKWFYEETKAALAQGGGMFDDPAKSYGGRLQSDYLVNYSVSGKVTSDQLDGVVYGMFTDFERGYEEHQAGGLGFLSSFSPEDLPSDHVGFWTYMNGKGLNEIPFVLGSLGEVSPTLPPFLLTGEKNCAFTPLVPEPFFGRNMIWNHVPWPDWLYITPIPSGLDTWQRH